MQVETAFGKMFNPTLTVASMQHSCTEPRDPQDVNDRKCMNDWQASHQADACTMQEIETPRKIDGGCELQHRDRSKHAGQSNVLGSTFTRLFLNTPPLCE